MPVLSSLDLAAVTPELFLAVTGMLLLVGGVFAGERSARAVTWGAILVLVVGAVLVATKTQAAPAVVLNGLFRTDGFGAFMKVVALLGAAVTLILGLDHLEKLGISRFEFPVLVVFSTLGMMMMISANDLMSLYVGLEVQSLAIYVIASFHRDNIRSTEAGLKYFVLGALSSGMLLYGASMVYGFAGSTSFTTLAGAFHGGHAPIGVIVGLVFVIAGLAFKVSAVPFHMWTPDVYEGAPTPVTAFMAAAPKVAAIGLFVRVMTGPFGELVVQWQQVVSFVAAASMILGAFAAINQTNIKRLMAYSSIANMGYALIGLACGTPQGITGVLVYMAIYVVMSLGSFALIIAMRSSGQPVETIADLAGLSRTRPMMALGFAIFMFSMAGIPPLAGFFSKLYVFLAAIEAHLYTLAIIGVLSSVVGAYYYLRIVKLIYFDEPKTQFEPMAAGVSAVALVTALATVLFFIMPAPVIDQAARAAATLFHG